MKDNVVNLFDSDELKHCSYYEMDGIGVAMLDKSVMVLPLNSNEFELTLGQKSKVYKRAELAEFLKVAGMLIDSEDRFLPDVELIGLNYT